MPPPPPPPAAVAAGSTGVPIMLPSSINTPRGYYNKNENFGSFNMQPWEKQPYQSLPSLSNQQQQQHQDQSKLLFICLFAHIVIRILILFLFYF